MLGPSVEVSVTDVRTQGFMYNYQLTNPNTDGGEVYFMVQDARIPAPSAASVGHEGGNCWGSYPQIDEEVHSKGTSCPGLSAGRSYNVYTTLDNVSTQVTQFTAFGNS